jgi:ABC-type uncharacterized transport system involved in gliding motility auxiliary subunit
MTEAIRSLSDRVSALLAMDEDIRVTLYFSSSLANLGGELGEVAGRIEGIVENLNDRYYGRLDYQYRDPDSSEELATEAGQYRMPSYRLRRPGTSEIATAFAGIAVTVQDRVYASQILASDLTGVNPLPDDTIEGAIEDSINALLGIQDSLGYVVDFGTPPYRGNPRPTDQVRTDLAGFYDLVSRRYGLRGLSVATDPIPESVGTIMVVSPTERLSDYALFQIDQFLMRGNSLILFLDAFTVTIPGRSQGAMYGEAYYEPRDTGIAELLEHYGVRLEQAYVLDEECYVQRSQTASGGMTEMPVYFAPIIRRRNLEERPEFVDNLDEIIVPNVSPLERVAPDGAPVSVRPVLASSPKSWRETDPQVLNYLQMMQPPPSEEESRHVIAYLLEGRFTSYFADKALPTPPEEEGQELALQSAFVPESRGGRIFVIGTSSVLGANLVNGSGEGSNSQLLLNLIDAMNGREDLAQMRSKGSMISRLDETTAVERSLIKTMNIAGLPVLVVLAGVVVWMVRGARRRRIREAFLQEGEAKK